MKKVIFDEKSIGATDKFNDQNKGLKINPEDFISSYVHSEALFLGDCDNIFKYFKNNSDVFPKYIDIQYCFRWVRHFNGLDSFESYDDTETSVSKIIVDRIEDQYKKSPSTAMYNLIQILNTLFSKIDSITMTFNDEMTYSKLLSAFLEVKSLNVEFKYPAFRHNSIIKIIIEYVFDQLEFRKEMLKEIVQFNNISKNKIQYYHKTIELAEIKKERKSNKKPIQSFSDLWIDKYSIKFVLDYFVENYPDKLISFDHGQYSYNDRSNKKQIKLAGFLIALSHKKWISISGLSSPDLIRLVNDFFSLDIGLNDNNFKSQMLLKLSEIGTGEHERHVKPLLLYIKNKE